MKYGTFKTNLIESNCQKCSGLCEKRTNIVVDRGNADSNVLVIGEAPGRDEDLKGKPFVGQAGKLLDKIMASINLSTETDMLITNVVKCRPPNNRVPTPKEVENCFPYLEWQLRKMRPKVVVLLGATSAKYFFDISGGMGQVAGSFLKHPNYPDTQFVILYHPAALLYDASKKKVMWEHIKKLRDYLKGENNGES